MNYSKVVFLFITSLLYFVCEANDLICQIYSKNLKNLENYCQIFNEKLPVDAYKNCVHQIHIKRSFQEAILRMGACNDNASSIYELQPIKEHDQI